MPYYHYWSPNTFIPRRRRPIRYSRLGFVTSASPKVAALANNRYDGVWCLEKRLKVSKAIFQTPLVSMKRNEETAQQEDGFMKHPPVKVGWGIGAVGCRSDVVLCMFFRECYSAVGYRFAVLWERIGGALLVVIYIVGYDATTSVHVVLVGCFSCWCWAAFLVVTCWYGAMGWVGCGCSWVQLFFNVNGATYMGILQTYGADIYGVVVHFYHGTNAIEGSTSRSLVV
ncbi:hypothetical protein U1Q18_006380 [Sarracenia purpurea var. burkii]